MPLVVTVWAAGLYLLGVRSLHRRGDAWPVGRTVMFVGLGEAAVKAWMDGRAAERTGPHRTPNALHP